MTRPLLPALKEFQIASRAFAAMGRAEGRMEFEDEWKRFLDSLEKGWNKLELSLTSSDLRLRRALGHLVAFRKEDSLLRYLRHARNADHHTLDPVMLLQPGSLAIGVAPGAGAAYIERLTYRHGDITQLVGRGVRLQKTPPTFKLVAVRDRGVTYSVPTEHLGFPLRQPSPMLVARLGLRFYEITLDELSTHFDATPMR